MKEIEARIRQIREQLQSQAFTNESAVREALILPILQCLGWEIFDPSQVRREYPVGERRVDYALFTSQRTPTAIIEVKAVGRAQDADRQLFEYAFHSGIPFAILSDGREWSFYLPAEQGSYEERRVYRLDLVERQENEAVASLQRYLSVERVRSGAAIEDARKDYKDAARRRVVRDEIPRVWAELVSEPDELLLELIAERVESNVGFRPDYEDVEAFLVSLLRREPAIVEPPARIMTKVTAVGGTPADTPSTLTYQLLGQTKKTRDAIAILLDVLRVLADRQPDFLERFANVARGRTRNHIARQRSDVYPGRPDLEQYTQELRAGWWIGTNIANRDKLRLLKIACQVAGLRFGSDLIVNLPNT
jgi:hypothetical protein